MYQDTNEKFLSIRMSPDEMERLDVLTLDYNQDNRKKITRHKLLRILLVDNIEKIRTTLVPDNNKEPKEMKQHIATANQYRMDTSRFIDVWAQIIEEDKNWNQFLELLAQEFDSDNSQVEGGLKEASVRSKCSHVNKKIAALREGKRLPVPPKTVKRRSKVDWEDFIATKGLDLLLARK